MIIPSPYEDNDIEQLNPFATIIEDGTTPDFADSSYMQMGHYDEKFKDLEPCISDDSTMISPSYSSYSSDACHTEDSFLDIQHMVRICYHFQLCPSRSIEEFVQPALPYIGKPLMIHLNKIEEGRWTCMTFIPQSHNIYCLYLHLKHEGMDYIVDNSKVQGLLGLLT